uniref:SLC26A/SulP transporter domain-containing protein n=1 Tax=Meloidogyne javanica TaxID=6303 RepID=A0A915N5Y8_MELJA
MLAGGIAKTFAVIIAYPHEVIRTRLREEGNQLRLRQLVRTLWREGYIKPFYRGLSVQDSIVENQPQAVANDLCGASAHSGSGGVSNLPLPRYQLSNADEGDHLWSSKHCPTTHLPIIRVIQRYSFRKDLFGDFRAGLALSLHGTAEGLAMAFLAGLPPICGLYTTFYSSLVYLFFGTSNFSFMGTNLAVCFFLGNIIERNTTVEGNNIISYESLEVASTAIILCAIVNQASIAIASNSIPATTTSFPCILWAYYRRLNVPNNSKKTSFNLINQNLSSSILNSTKIIKNNIIESENNCLPSIWECFDAINLNTLAASLLCIFLIIFTRQIIGPLTRFRLRSAISSEFLLELISINLINLLSTFVSAIPPGHSPLRTSIGTRAGAKTILANISLVLSLIPIIIWSSKLFQSLPICVLSCILLTEICPMFTGIAKLPLLWEISRLDVLSFVFSALMALFSSNLSQALFGSVILSAGTIIVRAQWPRLQQLTNVTGSGAYYAERCYYGACIRESAAKIKGQLLGIGIGTRTGSMKSMKSTNAQIVSGSIHNKDSIQMRSTLLISGDFVPNIENPGGAAINVIRELFEELADKKCRLLLASVNSTIRNCVSLNGCRDLITLSNAASNHELNLHSTDIGGGQQTINNIPITNVGVI